MQPRLSISVNSAILSTSLFLINTVSEKEREREKARGERGKCHFAPFGGRTMKPPAYGRDPRSSFIPHVDPNELSGIHTDVALSPSERKPTLILEDLMNSTETRIPREAEGKRSVSRDTKYDEKRKR